MDYVAYEFPVYAQDVIDKLIQTDWFIHSFPLNNEKEIYNPSAYLYNNEFNGVKYTVHLDLNVYQYVLSAFKKETKNELHRNAMALMLFGKFTNIMFDPTIAIYEKLNYQEQCPDEIVDDLVLFRRIDNSDMDELAQFVEGSKDSIKLPKIPDINKSELKKNLTKYKRLKKWDTLYLLVLKATELYFFDTSPNERKIEKFWSWCNCEFLYSLVATSFVIKLFGSNPVPKLMKYNPKHSAERNKKHLINMTWDLFLLDKFFENWVKKDANEEFIYASNDKPLKEVLEIAISIQNNNNANSIDNDLSPSLMKNFESISNKMAETKGRRIVKVTDFKKYRDELIKSVEETLLERA